jgi:hypothetical protein
MLVIGETEATTSSFSVILEVLSIESSLVKLFSEARRAVDIAELAIMLRSLLWITKEFITALANSLPLVIEKDVAAELMRTKDIKVMTAPLQIILDERKNIVLKVLIFFLPCITVPLFNNIIMPMLHLIRP